MAKHDIQEMRKVSNDVPLKDMDLDAKKYAVISIHGEVLADCPTIHYAKFFSYFSPRVVNELLDRLEAAERGTRHKQERAQRNTVKTHVLAMTPHLVENDESVVYYQGSVFDPELQTVLYEWSTNIEDAFPYLRREDAEKQMDVLVADAELTGRLRIHHYNYSL